jgi:tetratricopeptide (TPR) repeat protein
MKNNTNIVFDKIKAMGKKILLFFIFFVIATNAFSQVDPLVQTAYDKLDKRNFEGALQDFNQVLLLKSNNIEALCGRADTKINLGDLPGAMKDIEQVLTLDNNNTRAYVLKGEVYFNQKDYNNALQMFSHAVDSKNPPEQAIIGKAKSMNQLGYVKEAYKILDDAIAAQPADPEFYYARGILNNTKDKYSKALSDFDKAVKLNPKFNPFGIALNTGIAYLNLEEYESAIDYLTKAVNLDPTNASAFHSRGLANYSQENFKEAVEDFLKSFELNPNNPTVLFNLGMAYYKVNDTENACLYFHKSCQLGNTNSCKMIVMVCTETKR